MSEFQLSSAIKAKQDFERARRLADLKSIMARVTGQPIGLLSYEEVRQKLKAYGVVSRGLQDIPLDAIIGSVGRYAEFTRDFLPKLDESGDRWIKIKVAVDEPSGVPHIEVYKIGDAYFVLDGHHRVSVAKQIGSKYIQANVIEVDTKVHITPEINSEDLIIKAEYADFLEKFKVNKLRPNVDLNITAIGGYRILEEHIEVHRYFMGIENERFIPLEEAFNHWYDNVYFPISQSIRKRGILREFPNRTETDLYIWISEHRAALEKELGWVVNSDAVASDFAEQRGSRLDRVATRLTEKIVDSVMPEELETGPPPGEWRRYKIRHEGESLFSDLLIPLSSENNNWNALEQALVIAKKEGSRLFGLHVMQNESDKDKPEVLTLKESFEGICNNAAVSGTMAFSTGKVSQRICDRARWVDLLVVSLKHPPPTKPTSKLISGISSIIRRCPRPILAVPGVVTNLETGLLAYDGSAKSEEALFLSAYLASKWGLHLTVITISEKGLMSAKILSRAREYLEKLEIKAEFIEGHGKIENEIIDTAHSINSELIIMGGYGRHPLVEITLGSSLDKILQISSKPILICR
ncbi:MAG: universal stress protein [Anaerolineales bacterium]|nr:universal stress protein [Anaerolineales bacterium]